LTLSTKLSTKSTESNDVVWNKVFWNLNDLMLNCGYEKKSDWINRLQEIAANFLSIFFSRLESAKLMLFQWQKNTRTPTELQKYKKFQPIKRIYLVNTPMKMQFIKYVIPRSFTKSVHTIKSPTKQLKWMQPILRAKEATWF
jgi:hypothetical protein